MKCVNDGLKAFFNRDWSMAEKLLVISVCFLGGMIHGFIWAPIKKGISCGNNNGNNYMNGEPEEAEE